MRQSTFPCILLFLMLCCTSGKYLSGNIKNGQSWVFVSEFSFVDDQGKLEYKVEYSVTGECCPSLAYYSHDSYKTVSTNNDMDCQSKLSRAQGIVKFQSTPTNDSSNISGNYSSQCFHIIDKNLRKCSGILRVYSPDQWWFFALSHCNSSQGLDISYEFTFTNSDNWEEHLSGEEMHGVENLAVSFGSILVLFGIGLLFARRLLQLDKLHKAFKVFMASLSCEVIAQLLICIYYIPYVRGGIQIPYLTNAAELLHLTSQVTFILLLILLAHGWTMTKARISRDLAKFCSLLAFTYGCLFAYKQAFSDHLIAHFFLEGLADKGYQFLRIIAWVCFTFGLYLSFRNHSDKKIFYLYFGALCSVWFLFEPLSTLAFSFLLSGPSSMKIMRLFRSTWLDILGFGGILRLMLPSMVDVVFPHRVPVNEVDTVQVQDWNNFQRTEHLNYHF